MGCSDLLSQSENTIPNYNFDFEKVSNPSKLPDGWFKWGTNDYSVKTDTSVKHGGNYSVLIEAKKNLKRSSYGCVGYAVPANYLGAKIEVRAYLRFEDTYDSEIGLLLRIDDKNQKVLEYENGRQRNVHGGGFWNYYAATLPFPAKAKTIYLGALLNGTGKLWVDDFQLLIDGKPITEAKQKAKLEFKADRDDEFNASSGISAISVSQENVETLYWLGKIWGFLKCYHPSVAKGNYNWDNELFRMMPKALQCKTTVERNALLSLWIRELGGFNNGKNKKVDSAQVNSFIDLTWLNDTLQLGNKLSEQLNEIKNVKRPDESYYIDLSRYSGEVEFKNERTYEKLNYPDVGYQLLCLFRYWNAIEYYYPYKNLLDEKWNDVLKAYIPRFMTASNELKYKQTVLSLLTHVDDPNANIMAPNPIVSEFKGNNKAAIDVSFVGDKAVVTAFPAKPDISKINLKLGDVILSIDGKSTDDVVLEKTTYTSAANKIGLLRNISFDLLRTNDTLMHIKYMRENTIDSTVVKCYSREMLFKLKTQQKHDTCFKQLANGILYIDGRTLRTEFIEKIMPTIFKSKGVVIDLRGFPTENFVNALGDYLLPESKPYTINSKTSIQSPGLFTYGEKKTVGSENHVYYRGKVAILVNEQTQGISEFHAMAFRLAPKSVIIGSTTMGANGNLSEIKLPGAVRTMISTTGAYYPDGKQLQRIGVVPDLIVSPTIKGIVEQKDEQFEKAIELLSK